MNYKEYFKGKKITMLGLGLIGKGFINPAFLASCGAEIIATDLKTEEELRPTIDKLKIYPNITFHLGGHKFEDFENVDLVIKNQGVPLDSPYVAHAKASGVPVEMDEALFAKLAPEVTIIGVTGTRGKSTVSNLIYHIIAKAGKRVFLSGNLPNSAVLPLLEEVKEGDIVVLELSSWQLQGFGEDKISPHVAVFTTFMPDHMNYYGGDLDKYFDDKANIFKYQKKGDFLVVGEDVEKHKAFSFELKASKIIARREGVPEDWKSSLLGEHNRLNIACAIEACRAIGISDADIKNGVESFEAVEGRLQFVKEIGGVKIYNDNNATTPTATIAGLLAVSAKSQITNNKPKEKNIILILGGSDKGLELDELVEEAGKTCKKIILLPGSGSEKLKAKSQKLEASIIGVQNLSEAVVKAVEQAESGDVVLFSPAFSSFGLFKNEYDRNNQFKEELEKLRDSNE